MYAGVTGRFQTFSFILVVSCQDSREKQNCNTSKVQDLFPWRNVCSLCENKQINNSINQLYLFIHFYINVFTHVFIHLFIDYSLCHFWSSIAASQWVQGKRTSVAYVAVLTVSSARESLSLYLHMLHKPRYLLVVLEEPPHQDGGALFTVPDKICIVRETACILLLTAATAAAAVLAAAPGSRRERCFLAS